MTPGLHGGLPVSMNRQGLSGFLQPQRSDPSEESRTPRSRVAARRARRPAPIRGRAIRARYRSRTTDHGALRLTTMP